MKYIIISGIDGSGKTTIIKKLQERLEAKGFKVRYEWLRYNHMLVKPVHGLCRLIKLSRRYKTHHGYIWRHEFYRNQLFCSIYIFLTWFDTWFGKLILTLKLIWKITDFVICDRWVYDILIDLAVVTRRPLIISGKWHRRYLQILPKNRRQYLLIRDTNAILRVRRENLNDPEFVLRQELYEQIMQTDEIIIIKNDTTIDKTVDTIMTDMKKKKL